MQGRSFGVEPCSMQFAILVISPLIMGVVCLFHFSSSSKPSKMEAVLHMLVPGCITIQGAHSCLYLLDHFYFDYIKFWILTISTAAV